MLIKLINPNTTWAMTDKIGQCAREVVARGTIVEAVSPSMGPASIESHYDEALSVVGLLDEIASGERVGVDGYVIACFGDPGLDAARELARGPVVGIAEAAMHAASMLGRTFSVVTTLSRTAGRAWDLAERYGMARSCQGVHACEIPVLELDAPGSAAEWVITEACRQAVATDGCDSIVLGCAGMADLCQRVADAIGIPVIDGVRAATVMVESLVRLGLATSAGGEFAPPPPKEYTGLLAKFTVPDVEVAARP